MADLDVTSVVVAQALHPTDPPRSAWVRPTRRQHFDPTHNVAISARSKLTFEAASRAVAAAPSPGCPRETHAEKAARLQRKSLELQYKDIRLKVEKILKERPDSLPKVRDYLISLRLWDDLPASAGASGVAASPSTGKAQDAGATEEGGSTEATPKGKVPHKTYTRMENIPVVHLRRWLGDLEKCAFSEGALNMLVKRGKLEQSRAALVELLEFTTGIDPGQPLFAGARDDEAMSRVGEQCVQLNLQRGRVGKEIVLPADWSAVGYYEVVKVGSEVRLRHRYNGKSGPVPLHIMGSRGIAGLTVLMNFSEN